MPHSASVTPLYAVLRGGRGAIPPPDACVVSTWTLMPLRAACAFKHNHKADPPFPATEKNGPETVTRNPKWRIWIERPHTGGSQSLPEAFLPSSFLRAHSGVGVS